MNATKIRVVWIANFSDSKVRSHLSFRKAYLEGFVRKITGHSSMRNHDFSKWVSNGIQCMEDVKDIELHVVSPHRFLKGELQEFVTNNIHYHFYSDESYKLVFKIKRALGFSQKPLYSNNRKIITNLIDKIKPEIIHLIGAENEFYALSILDMPHSVPIIAQLQTLLNDPEFIKRSPIYSEYKRECERKVLQRADYIGTSIEHFRNIITNSISSGAKYLSLKLAVGEDLDIHQDQEKVFDFVYFAVNINKAADYALEAFALACQKYPSLTLDIIGAYDYHFKKLLDKRASELGVFNNIKYEGLLPTHADVIEQVKKSKYALLPLKVDMISGTIRESMSLGLPVVSTITPCTPELNEKRQSLLLSDKGDFAAMAANMVKLIESEQLCQKLVENASITIDEKYSNKAAINMWIEAYKKITNK